MLNGELLEELVFKVLKYDMLEGRIMGSKWGGWLVLG